MKKIMIIDGGPREKMNTAALIESFAKGAQSAGEGVEVRRVRLYELDYKGCRSCLACKLRGKSSNVCVFRDDLTPVFEEMYLADALVLASPIYMGTMTAQLQALLERLVFPWLSYVDFSTNAPKRMPLAFLYTMNASEQFLELINQRLQFTEELITKGLGEAERVLACDTVQVKDYDRYEYAPGTKEAKLAHRDAHWQQSLDRAFAAGKRMAEQILAT